MAKLLIFLFMLIFAQANSSAIPRNRDLMRGKVFKRYMTGPGPIATSIEAAFYDLIDEVYTDCQLDAVDTSQCDDNLCSTLGSYDSGDFLDLFDPIMWPYTDIGEVCGIDVTTYYPSDFSVPIPLTTYPGECTLMCNSAEITGANMFDNSLWDYDFLEDQQGEITYFINSQFEMNWDGCSIECTPCTGCFSDKKRELGALVPDGKRALGGLLQLVCNLLNGLDDALNGLIWNLLNSLGLGGLEGLCNPGSSNSNSNTGANVDVNVGANVNVGGSGDGGDCGDDCTGGEPSGMSDGGEPSGMSDGGEPSGMSDGGEPSGTGGGGDCGEECGEGSGGGGGDGGESSGGGGGGMTGGNSTLLNTILNLVCQLVAALDRLLNNLVSNLLNSLGLSLNEICNGGGGGGGCGFSGDVTITQYVNATIASVFYPSDCTSYVQAVYLDTDAEFGDGIPTEYYDDLNMGIYYLLSSMDVNFAILAYVEEVYYYTNQAACNYCDGG